MCFNKAVKTSQFSCCHFIFFPFSVVRILIWSRVINTDCYSGLNNMIIIIIIWSPTSSHKMIFYQNILYNYRVIDAVFWLHFVCVAKSVYFLAFCQTKTFYDTTLDPGWHYFDNVKYKWWTVESIIKEMALILTAPAQAALCFCRIKPPSWIMTLWSQIFFVHACVSMCRLITASVLQDVWSSDLMLPPLTKVWKSCWTLRIR